MGTSHKERTSQSNVVETPEVFVPAIHDVEPIGFEIDQVEDVQIVDFPCSYMYKTGYRVLQIELHVKLHGRFRLAEMGPCVNVQAEVDDRRIDGKDIMFEFDLKLAVGTVQTTRLVYQRKCEVGVYPPVSRFVGSRQRGLRDRTTDAHVIQLRGVRVQTQHRVAQTLSMRHLPERHAQKLFPAAKMPGPTFALITLDAPIELVMINKRNDLRKNVLPFIHMKASLCRKSHSHFKSFNIKTMLNPLSNYVFKEL